jgi:hypothetical protein
MTSGIGNSQSLTLSSMDQVICDLAYLNAYSSTISEAKLCSWRSVFSTFFASGLSPYNDAFMTYSAKSKKIKKCRSYETLAVEILPP